jgi:UrcA family protein
MTLTKTVAALAAASAATLFFSAAACAQEDDTVVDGPRGDRPVAYVRYQDINLGTEEGVGKLHARVRRTADAMCMDNGVTSLHRWTLGQKCMKAAIASAEPQITRVVARFRDRDLAARLPISLRGAD